MEAQQLAGRYQQLLVAYLKDGNEAALNRGYELGRGALVDGRGALELAAIHHEALRRIAGTRSDVDAWLKQAEAFFAECLSPFEMSHRGAQEGTRALRHLNELFESEVKRIAHALHDEAGQLLASVHILLADIAGDLPQARKRFDDVERLLRDVEGQLRDFSHELRPTVLDNLGLVAALEFLADKVTKRTGLAVSVAADHPGRLPAAVETALYRIVQEALNNTVKHAQARSAVIELQLAPNKVSCSVRDDGRGFATPPGRKGQEGFGLIGIRERLNALGGALRIVTKPEQGSTLFADIPL